MIKYKTTIRRFDKRGEKTGWSYIEITAAQAKKLKPNTNVSFRVKGRLDQYVFEKLSLLCMGNGNFILPVNAAIRRSIGKKHGDRIAVEMHLDKRKLTPSRDLMACLAEDPKAMTFFKSLPGYHQNYFSKW